MGECNLLHTIHIPEYYNKSKQSFQVGRELVLNVTRPDNWAAIAVEGGGGAGVSFALIRPGIQK